MNGLLDCEVQQKQWQSKEMQDLYINYFDTLEPRLKTTTVIQQQMKNKKEVKVEIKPVVNGEPKKDYAGPCEPMTNNMCGAQQVSRPPEKSYQQRCKEVQQEVRDELTVSLSDYNQMTYGLDVTLRAKNKIIEALSGRVVCANEQVKVLRELRDGDLKLRNELEINFKDVCGKRDTLVKANDALLSCKSELTKQVEKLQRQLKRKA